MDLTELVPLDRVERAFEANLQCLHTHLVSLVLMGDYANAHFYAKRIQKMEHAREEVRITYTTRQMALSEFKVLAEKWSVPDEPEPRPTAWERLLAGVE